jgi:hypothetical protein
MALKYLNIRDYSPFYVLRKINNVVFGWKFVKNLTGKNFYKNFLPKLSFVKSIPGVNVMILKTFSPKNRQKIGEKIGEKTFDSNYCNAGEQK